MLSTDIIISKIIEKRKSQKVKETTYKEKPDGSIVATTVDVNVSVSSEEEDLITAIIEGIKEAGLVTSKIEIQ